MQSGTEKPASKISLTRPWVPDLPLNVPAEAVPLRVLSYNILADSNSTATASYYFDASDLLWKNRQPKIKLYSNNPPITTHW